MTDTKTFDLGKFLQGVDRPKNTLRLHWDINLATRIIEIEKQIAAVPKGQEEELLVDLLKAQDELIAQREKTAIIIEIQGVPQGILEQITLRVEKKHPLKEGFTSETQFHRSRMEADLTLQSYITSVTDPSGNVESPASEATVSALRAYLLPAQMEKLGAAIRELENVSLGFEIEASQPDFS